MGERKYLETIDALEGRYLEAIDALEGRPLYAVHPLDDELDRIRREMGLPDGYQIEPEYYTETDLSQLRKAAEKRERKAARLK